MPEKVEWARAKQIFAQFGIGRSTLYRLAKEGRIESRLIKGENSSKGTRIFNVQSVRELVEASLP